MACLSIPMCLTPISGINGLPESKELSIPDRVLFETVREAPLEKFRDRRLREVKSVGTVGGGGEQTDGSIGVIRNL